MKALVVIPAYNEENNIGGVLAQLQQLNPAVDILVVDDGSIDQTATIAKQAGVGVISHPCNLGYGAALQSGFKFADRMGYSHIVQFDADGQHAPEDIHTVLRAFQASVDVVIGSRFLGDPAFYPGWQKQFAIRFFRGLIRIATGQRVTDPTSGIRGLSRNVFHYYSIRNRFPSDFPDADIIIDMLLQARRLVEVPVHHQSRAQGVSMHIGLKPIVYMFKILISILSVLLNNWLIRGEA